jgi:hypothetical protein
VADRLTGAARRHAAHRPHGARRTAAPRRVLVLGGTATLFDHCAQVLGGAAAPERGDHAVF